MMESEAIPYWESEQSFLWGGVFSLTLLVGLGNYHDEKKVKQLN
jgi:hypothetical protein